jgi:hypothetical protein
VENNTSSPPHTETGSAGIQNPFVICFVQELRPHPAYVRHKLSVQASQLAALTNLGDLAFQYPLIITRSRLIIDGYGRCELAKQKGRATLRCVEYDLTQEQALEWLLQTHRRVNGLNDFTRIELALDLEPYFQEKGQLNQQAGGRSKGLSKLTKAGRVDVRQKIGEIAGASPGNVRKTKNILANGCFSVVQAARVGEISINLADKWSRESRARQEEYLRLRRIERGIMRKARQLISPPAEDLASSHNPIFEVSNLLQLSECLAVLGPEQSNELGPVEVKTLNVPGKRIYITDDLARALKSQGGVERT